MYYVEKLSVGKGASDGERAVRTGVSEKRRRSKEVPRSDSKELKGYLEYEGGFGNKSG